MLTNSQFFSSFIPMLLLMIGISVIGLVAVVVWKLSRPFRNWLLYIYDEYIATVFIIAIDHVKDLLAVPFAGLRRAFTARLIVLNSILKRIPWGMSVAIIVIIGTPLYFFISTEIPSQSVMGIVAAGAVFGIICAPFVGWHYRSRLIKAIYMSLLSIAGGVYGAIMLIMSMTVMASG